MLVTKQLTVAIDFNSIFFHTMEVNGYRQLLMVATGLEQLEGEWQNFHF